MRLSQHKTFLVFACTIALFVFGEFSTHASAFAQAVPTIMEARRVSLESAPAEVTISFSEQLANAFLDALFANLKAPTFKLARATDDNNVLDKLPRKSANAFSNSHAMACTSEVVLLRETDGVRTAVHFTNNRIVAPLAFAGTYNTGLLGCVRFRGWANALVNLEYDRERQALHGRVAVQDFHLNDLSPRAASLVKDLVQSAIDKRVNPIEILQAAQLAARVPITAAGGALRLRIVDMRPEILQNELRLHLFYEVVRAE